MQKIGNMAVVLSASCHVVKWVALNLFVMGFLNFT
jgi:uncharacterized membrane protein